MKKTLILLFLAAILPLTAQAGEVNIRETETAIFVEYTGEPEAAPAEIKPAEAAVVAIVAPIQTVSGDDEGLISENSRKKAERATTRAKAKALKRDPRIAQGTQQEGTSYQEEYN
jgi:hypothetical protein